MGEIIVAKAGELKRVLHDKKVELAQQVQQNQIEVRDWEDEVRKARSALNDRSENISELTAKLKRLGNNAEPANWDKAAMEKEIKEVQAEIEDSPNTPTSSPDSSEKLRAQLDSLNVQLKKK